MERLKVRHCVQQEHDAEAAAHVGDAWITESQSLASHWEAIMGAGGSVSEGNAGQSVLPVVARHTVAAQPD